MWIRGNMKVVCSACGKYIKDKPADPTMDHEISHSLCENCACHFRAQAGIPIEEYLETIEAPVVTIAPNVTISTLNTKAMELLGKSIKDIQGKLGGDVFECEYARLPGGCGETIHCSGCTIRNTVIKTLRTGIPMRRIPAILNRFSESGTEQIDLLITTEKIGGIVFLKIDKINDHASEE
jgi:hypothetical protein